MNLKQMKNLYKGFEFEEEDVWNYGIDGGGTGLRVSFDGEDLFFVWCTRGSNRIAEIIVLSKKYKTSDKIHVGMGVSELLKIDPTVHFRMDLLSGNEVSFSKKSNVHIVFYSEDDDTVGKYFEKCPDCDSRAVNFDREITYLYIH